MILLPQNWECKHSTTHNKPYYYNTITKKRQWTVPSVETEKHKEIIKKFYDEVGTIKSSLKHYKIFLQSVRSLLIKFFCSTFTTVLDIGCGTGNDCQKWMHAQYTGLDINENMLKIFKERFPKIKCMQADITDENTFVNIREKYNCITCFDTLQYASYDKESLKTAIRGMRKCLNDNGFLLLLVYDDEWPNKNMIEYPRQGILGTVYHKKVTNDMEIPEWTLPIKSLVYELENADFKIDLNANMSSVASYMGVQSPLETKKQQMMYHEIVQCMSKCKVIDSECWEFLSSYRFIICKPKLSKDIIDSAYEFIYSPWNN